MIAHKFNPVWSVSMVKSVERKSVDGQFADKYKDETFCWTKKLRKDQYGINNFWVLSSDLQNYF